MDGRLAHVTCVTDDCVSFDLRIVEFGSGAAPSHLALRTSQIHLFTSWSPDQGRIAVGGQVETSVMDALDR